MTPPYRFTTDPTDLTMAAAQRTSSHLTELRHRYRSLLAHMQQQAGQRGAELPNWPQW